MFPVSDKAKSVVDALIQKVRVKEYILKQIVQLKKYYTTKEVP